MNMTALTIVVYNLVIFDGRKFAFEGIFNLKRVTTRKTSQQKDTYKKMSPRAKNHLDHAIF